MFTVITDTLRTVPAAAWNSLDHAGIPFLSHQFLFGLEHTGCVGNDSGWLPEHLLLFAGPERDTLLGAVPMYRKYHSYGEYVFDWAWASAYERAGLEYYPKLVVATPFTPVTGPRLLVPRGHPHAGRIRRNLADLVLQHARESGVSSLHWLFTSAADNEVLDDSLLLARKGNQFHWRNQDYADFQQYLGSMSAAKRKKIKRERRRINESGFTIEIVSGSDLTAAHMQQMHQFYLATIRAHGSYAYLSAGFFEELAHTMADQIVLILAHQHDECVAGSLNFRGSDGGLYGRYWGSLGRFDALHFELCYYRPIEYCIDNGIVRFEAGAQGEHKLSRGLLPATTHSRHWLRDPQFAQAVSGFLSRENHHVEAYTEVLQRHSPFRQHG